MSASSDLHSFLARYANLAMFDGVRVVSPDSANSEGDTPFHMAAFDDDVEALRAMIPHIKEVNLAGAIGNTPLHYALMNGSKSAAHFLLEHGADATRENDYGDTPAECSNPRKPA